MSNPVGAGCPSDYYFFDFDFDFLLFSNRTTIFIVIFTALRFSFSACVSAAFHRHLSQPLSDLLSVLPKKLSFSYRAGRI